ncbi:MAG TPA: mechanosensitive ion channel family protein [Chitinophagales bacterium]|nr:mechanosensitive ion channel family protein [Chitinophagales bacterium]
MLHFFYLLNMAAVWQVSGNGLAASANIILTKLESWGEALLELLPNFVLAIIVLIVFYLLAGLLAKQTNRVFNSVTKNPALSRIISGLAGFGIFFIGIAVALNVLKLDKAVASLLAGAGLAGLAIGFAFQDLIINFISGIIIVIKKPFSVGNLIETNSYMGVVEQMDFRSTHIQAPSGRWIVLPNRSIVENPVINYSKTGARRVELVVGIAYDEDLDAVKTATVEAVSKLPCLKKDTEVEFYFQEFSESSVDYVVRFWIDFDNRQADFLSARHEAIVAIFNAYKEKDIVIPFPIRTIYLHVNVEGEGKKEVTFNLTGEAVQKLVD